MGVDIEQTLDDLIARVARVRHWLLAISVLRSAAVGLAGISLYVGCYALLDHHVHLGRLGRSAAFVLFLAMIGAGLYYVVRVLRREMSYAHAANYIETRHSFGQQLVAAVEYYEGRGDYPYSQALARQLVRQVDRAAEGYQFQSTVARWQGYLLAGVVLLCLLVVGLFVRQNVLFVSSYLARLVRPLSEIAPISATSLEPVTDDIVTGTDTPVTFAAAVRGRMPDSALLVLTRREPHDANDSSLQVVEKMEAKLTRDAEGNPTITASESFEKPGLFEYRFETGAARSETHTVRVSERPAIKNITARITPPPRDGAPALAPYEQQVEGQKLEVLPGSRVELKMQATMPLQEASVVAPDGRRSVQQPNGADSFTYGFTANQASSMKLNVVNTDGLANSAPQELQVALKHDEPPQFKLVCPDGDYLATDVASIPIAFEVTDDFGLAAAELRGEFPGRGPVVLASASPQGARQFPLTYTLELEQYDLRVGDSILFYATAQDLDTGQRQADANGCSEMYFIEIRPYRQYWHPQPGGDEPSPQPGPILEDLITLLEYTRAIVKKTWTAAHVPQSAPDDRPSLASLAADVQYCEKLLTSIRDDPDFGFGAGDKAVLDRVLGHYEQAGEQLGRGDAPAALPPAENAYRTLRKLIDELHLKWSPPQSGPSSPQQTPERVKLQEQPEEPALDKERLESQLKEIQEKTDALARQEQSIKNDLTKALQQDKKVTRSAGQPTGQTSSGAGAGQPSAEESPGQQNSGQETSQQTSPSAAESRQTGNSEQAAQQSGSTQPGNSGGRSGQSGEGQGGSGSTPTQAEGSAHQRGQGPPSVASASSTGAQSSQAQSPTSAGSTSAGGSADMDARLRMLQARQQALREQAVQVGEQLSGLPAPASSEPGSTSGQALEHLKKAIEAMERFEEKLGEARYQSPGAAEAPEMTSLADSAARRLTEAGRALQHGLSQEEQASADRVRDMAEQLAKDAEAYDESLSDAEKQQMLARLEAAKKLLESMAGPQWTTMSSGGGPGAGHVFTKDPHASPGETARLLARQFWSLALEARQRRSRPLEDEPSDVEFFEAENEFFKKAAQFRQQRVEQ
jgi:hypothetical protein